MIILAGHSYGSFFSNALNQKYPNDVDATILTGFSSVFKTAMAGSKYFFGHFPFLQNLFVPASEPSVSNPSIHSLVSLE